MNIFRRPMFRGGKVDSRGTGITSGLSYNKGGRVGYEPGGQVTGGSLLQRAKDFFTKPALNPDGTPVQVPRRNFAEDMMFITGPGKFLKAGGGGLSLIRQMGKQPVFPPGYKAGFPKGMKSGELPQAPFLSNKYFKDLISPYTSGAKEILKPVGQKIKDFGIMGAIGLGGAGLGYSAIDDYIEDYADEQFKGKTENPLEEGPEEKALTPAEIENLELKKLLEELTKTKTAKETDMEESVEIDKEKFAKILGKDKARGQDIADMLLSFSSKALAPEATVKSAFAEFAADEVKRPSRARKIDDSAAALAINKYIKGEISKQEAEAFLNRAKVQSDLIKERSELTPGQAYAQSKSPTFAGRVKDAALTVFDGTPRFEVVESKDMIPVEEGGKFDFSQEDVGVIFIETDTRQSYTFDSKQRKIPFINA